MNFGLDNSISPVLLNAMVKELWCVFVNVGFITIFNFIFTI